MEDLKAQLTAALARVAELEQSLEMRDAQLRGMRDFLSGQPKDMPYREGQHAKESQLNFAWTMGYESAQDSDVLKLFVSRADRAAARADQSEADRSALQQGIAQLREYVQHKPKCEIAKEREANKGNWCGTTFSLCTCGLANLLAAPSEPQP